MPSANPFLDLEEKPAASTYETSLSPPEEAAFQKWKSRYAPNDSGADYDLRGAFKSGLTPDPQSGHWPDTFKKPNHPTFSDQSVYAKDRPELAGTWNGDQFVPPANPFAAFEEAPAAEPVGAFEGQLNTARRAFKGVQQSNEVSGLLGDINNADPEFGFREYLTRYRQGRGDIGAIKREGVKAWEARTEREARENWDAMQAVKPQGLQESVSERVDRGLENIPRRLEHIAQLQGEIEAIPESADVQSYQNAQGLWEKLKVVAANPIELPTNIAVRGGVSSLPIMAAGTAGGIVGGPLGAAIATGALSYETDVAASMLESFGQAGIDIRDPKQVAAALRDPAFIKNAKNRAEAHGVPVALFDALSAGIAGRIVNGVRMSVGGIVKAGAKEIAQQAALGAGGEATGQLVAQGKITDPTAVFEEAVGEIVPGAREITQNVVTEQLRRVRAQAAAQTQVAASAVAQTKQESQNVAAATVTPVTDVVDEVETQSTAAELQASQDKLAEASRATNAARVESNMRQQQAVALLEQASNEELQLEAALQPPEPAQPTTIEELTNAADQLGATAQTGSQEERLRQEEEQRVRLRNSQEHGVGAVSGEVVNAGAQPDAQAGGLLTPVTAATLEVAPEAAAELARTPPEKVAQVQAALANPNAYVQYTVWPADMVPAGADRVAQVDLIDQTLPEGQRNVTSTNRQFAAALGRELPAAPEWLPMGRYTETQIRDAIAAGPPARVTTAPVAQPTETPAPAGNFFEGGTIEQIPSVTETLAPTEIASPAETLAPATTSIEQVFPSPQAAEPEATTVNPFAALAEKPAVASPAMDELIRHVRETLARADALPTRSDKLINTLNSLKLHQPGELFAASPLSLAWDAAIDTAILAIKAGRAIGDVITTAVAKFRELFPDATPDDVTRLEQSIRDGFQEAPPATPKEVAIPEPPEGQGVRNFAARVITDEAQPTEVRENLAARPEIFYEKFSTRALAELARKASDEELIVMRGHSDIKVSTAALIEQGNRASKAGRAEEAGQLYAQAAQIFTDPAQLLNVAKGLRNPLGFVKMLERVLEPKGRKLTPAERSKVTEAARKKIEADSNLEAAAEAAEKDFSEANEKAYREAREKAGKADLELQRTMQDFTPFSWADLFVMTMQGNLLTPLSQVANVFGNLAWYPARRGAKAIASALDFAYSSLTGSPRRIEATLPIPSQLEMRAAWEGIKIAGRELLTGPSEDSYVRQEAMRGFRPLRAWVQAITGEGLARNPKGEIILNDRIKKIVEGTVGIPAEVMFRLLNLGDRPFRRAAETEVLEEGARLRGLKGREAQQAVAFPDQETQARLETEGRSATFVQETAATRILTHFERELSQIPAIGPALRVFGRIVAPYRQFPVNFVTTALTFALPEIGLAKAVYHSVKGNRRAALTALGEAAVGAMLYGAAAVLWDAGLMSEPPDDDDAKKRSIQYEQMGPSRINLSGLARHMKGGDGAYRLGDRTVDYTRLGIPAAVFHIYTLGQARERTQQIRKGEAPTTAPGTASKYLQDRLTAFPGMATFAMDQSFLAGTNSFLEAIQETNPNSPKLQQWFANAFRMVSSIAVPNTFEAVARAEYKYVPELRGDNLEQTIANIWKYKTQQLPEDERAILKRGLFGEPILRTPAGSNAYIRQLLDVTKTEARAFDPLKQQLIELFQATGVPDVYPTPPSRTLQRDGVYVRLTPEDYEQLQIAVGSARRQEAQALVASQDFTSAPVPEKILLLVETYADAGRDAREDFIDSPEIQRRYWPGSPADETRTIGLSGRARLERMATPEPANPFELLDRPAAPTANPFEALAR